MPCKAQQILVFEGRKADQVQELVSVEKEAPADTGTRQKYMFSVLF